MLTVDEKSCPNGWGPGGCSYTGGCYCDRDEGHKGKCRCVCGSTRQNPRTALERVKGDE